MKKLVLLSMLGMLWMGCTKQESTVKPEETTVETNFLSIRIVASGNTTRSAGESYDDGNYRDGFTWENDIKSVLLLFFDSDGNPAKASKNKIDGELVSYYLLDDFDNKNDDHSQTVEKILTATIPITVPHENDNPVLPAQLFAIVNPPTNYEDSYTGKTLTELAQVYEDYETYLTTEGEKPNDHKTNFTMTNSVYIDEKGNTIKTTALSPNNFRLSSDENETLAATNAAVIYVERVLARIDLSIDIQDSNGKTPIPIKDDSGTILYYIYPTGKSLPTRAVNEGEREEDHPENPDVTDTDAYVRLLGWNVFDTPDNSRLMKSIVNNANEWSSTTLFGTNNGLVYPWNIPTYHRSSWAINPPKSTFSYKFGRFKNGEKSGDFVSGKDADNSDFDSNHTWTVDHNAIPAAGKFTTAYFQENAAPEDNVNNGPANPSKVIIAAQLVDDKGQPRALAKWAGQYFYSWDGLKAHFCNNELKNLWYLVKTTNPNGTIRTYYHIEPKFLGYTVDAGKDGASVVIKPTMEVETTILTDEGEEIVVPIDGWYVGTSEYDIKEMSEIKNGYTVNQYISDQIGENTVMIWENGYTYFYFPIRHFGENETDPGYYGVVRNHIYDAHIRSISGLGTPVAQIEEPIVIRPPKEDDGVLDAEVRILSWRVVRKDYDLTW